MTATVRDFDPRRDRPWAEALLGRDFGGRLQARRGELLDVLALPGLVAERDGRRDEIEPEIVLARRA